MDQNCGTDVPCSVESTRSVSPIQPDICLFRWQMLHFLQQPVAKTVCLLIGAGQEAYIQFTRASRLKTAPGNEAEQIRVCVPYNQNNELKEAEDLWKAERKSGVCIFLCGFVAKSIHWICS